MKDIKSVLSRNLSFWSELSAKNRELLAERSIFKKFTDRKKVHAAFDDCTGLIIVLKGRLRVFFLMEGGKEITIYKLGEGEICLFSASCIFKNISFDVNVMAEGDTDTVLIPSKTFQAVMNENLEVSKYINELMSKHFSGAMGAFEQLLSFSLEDRLRNFLLAEFAENNADTIAITHEEIAKNLGSAREAVSRILKSLEAEGVIRLQRGKIELINKRGLAVK